MSDASPQERVGIGLVGVGAFGEFCLAAFNEMPEVYVAAVADSDKARALAASAKYDTRFFSSLETMLRDDTIEIIALNTPPFLHAEQGLMTLNAGRHLFCEKPLALTVEDGQRSLDAAARHHALLTVDYVMRRNAIWAMAAQLRESGVLGALRHMDLANHAAGLNLPPDHWFWDKAKSGGIWVEHGVHFFDAFAWVAGEAGTITGAQQFASIDGVVDRVEAIGHYGNVAAHFYHAFDKSNVTEQTVARLTFEQGYITLNEWVPTTLHLHTWVDEVALQAQLAGFPGDVKLEHQPNGHLTAQLTLTQGKSAAYREAIQAGMRDLALAVRDPAHTLQVTGQHGLDSLRMAVQAEQLGRG